MKAISIIIPVYNTEKYLEKCINSVRTQTLPDIDIICVNDGSTDSSLSILTKLASIDERITVISQDNRGISSARNEGLKKATGEYILFLDSDDWYCDNSALEKLYSVAKNENLEVVFFEAEPFFEEGIPEEVKSTFSVRAYYRNIIDYGEAKSGQELFCEFRKHKNFRAPVSRQMYSRNYLAANEITFFEGILHEDELFTMQCLALAKKAKSVDIVAYGRLFRAGSIMTSKKIDLRSCFGYLNVYRQMIVFKEKHIDSFSKDFLEEYCKRLVVIESLCIANLYDVDQAIVSKEMAKLAEQDRLLLLHLKEEYDKSHKKESTKRTKECEAEITNKETNENHIKYDSIKYKMPISKKTYLKNKEKNKKNNAALKSQIHTLKSQIRTLKSQIETLESENKRKQAEIQNEHDFIRKNRYLIEMAIPESKYAEYLCDWFFRRTGERLNLKEPKTFNEKIQWLKLYDDSPLRTQLSDKYLVRDYVTEKIGEEYLPKLLGVYDNFDDINFSELPDRFALKANHGCRYNEIVRDKTTLDVTKLRKKVGKWLSENFAYVNGLELQYRNINRKIIVEEYLENEGKDLYDYKVFCFKGKAKYIMFLKERTANIKMTFFDTEWNKQEFVCDYERIEESIERPKNLKKMIELAEILSKEFTHVRVDFYVLNDGSIKFGEMTFTSFSGAMSWDPPEYNNILGNLIELK